MFSFFLFNLCSDCLFTEALHDIDEGINTNGEAINNIRYADDAALIADAAVGLQRLMNIIPITSERYGMKLNTTKTKVIIITKDNNTNDNKPLQCGASFSYLGCNLNNEWDHSTEINIRTEKARDIFNGTRSILCNPSRNLTLRIRTLRCCVFPVLLYGAETSA